MTLTAQPIVCLASVRQAKVAARAQELMASLSPEDLYTLQHDVMSRPAGSRLPACMKDSFFEWLGDCYGPYERETRMAPENQFETETEFLEDAIHGDDPELAAQAQYTLDACSLALVSPLDAPTPDCPMP